MVRPVRTDRYTSLPFFILVAVLTVLTPVSLGAADDVSQATESLSLEGTNWQLVQLTVLGGFVFTPDDPGKYVLNFRNENRLTGRSDCNQLSGLWQHEGSALSFDPFLSSRNLCLPGSLHNNLVLYLRDVVALEVRDDRLILTTTTEGVELEFEAR